MKRTLSIEPPQVEPAMVTSTGCGQYNSCAPVYGQNHSGRA